MADFLFCRGSQTDNTAGKLAKIGWQSATFDSFDTAWLRGRVGGLGRGGG